MIHTLSVEPQVNLNATFDDWLCGASGEQKDEKNVSHFFLVVGLALETPAMMALWWFALSSKR